MDEKTKQRILDRMKQSQSSLIELAEIQAEYYEFLRVFHAIQSLRWGRIGQTAYRMYRRLKRIVKRVISVFGTLLRGENTRPKRNRYGTDYSSDFQPYRVRHSNSSGSSRPRVLHAIQNFVTGGSSRLVVDIVEQLGHRFEQKVITDYLPDPPSFVGLPVTALRNPVSKEQLLRYLEGFKPDLLHIHYWGWGKRSWGWGWPSFLWYHKVFEAAHEYGCAIIENINIPTEPYISDDVDQYVYVSNFVRHEFGILHEKETVVYPGSDFRHFTRGDAGEAPDDCIGMVYRLDFDKLDEAAIDVFIDVVRRRETTNALIVGSGMFFDHYRRQVRKAGLERKFRFPGLVSYEDLPRYYRELSIFVAPVRAESFGQVAPFAMNMGIPVVGYNVGALEEIIADKDLLAPPGAVDKLSDIIISLLDDRDRRLEIGARNRRRAQELFSLEIMIERYGEMYGGILSSDRRRKMVHAQGS